MDLINNLSLKERKSGIEHHFEKIIEYLGIDLESTHFKGTPERIARMYVDEIFGGLYEEMPKFTVFDNEKDISEMVCLGSIDINSTCGHHFKAFTGKAHIAYIPDKKLVGISKLARVADWFARRPQVQEDLNQEIACFLMEQLQPKGIGVAIEAVHNCIRVRGSKQSSSIMYTTVLKGCFLDDKTVKDEFYEMIKRNN